MLHLHALVAHAEGHHSGQTETQVLFIPCGLPQEIRKILLSIDMHFHDLDGKHSEVEAEIHISTETKDSISWWFDECDGNDKLCNYVRDIVGAEMYKKIEEAHESIIKKLTQKTTVVTYFDGQPISERK